jgi:hypothetical protein
MEWLSWPRYGCGILGGNFMMPRLQRTMEPNPGLSPLLFGASRAPTFRGALTPVIEVTLVVPYVMTPKFVSFPSS